MVKVIVTLVIQRPAQVARIKLKVRKTMLKQSKRFIYQSLFCGFCAFLMNAAHAYTEPVSAEKWEAVARLQGITSARMDKTKTIFVFFDPNCPYSGKYFNGSINGNKVRDLSIVWIPVTHMGKTSEGKAATLLRLGNYQGMIRNFSKFDFTHNLGAIEAQTPTEEEHEALQNNSAVFTSLSSTPATPMTVYRDSDGAKVFLGYDSDGSMRDIAKPAVSGPLPKYQP